MLADKSLLEKLLEYIGKRLNHEVEGLLIGGNAMVFYGLREQTKDMDIVFFNKTDIAAITQIIKSHPLFRKSQITKEYPYKLDEELTKMGEPTVIGDNNLPRFDLFYNSVFSVEASDILEKTKRSLRFDLLKLKLIEPEDLIFLKGVSGRPVDKEDIIKLIKNLEINWESFLNFVKKKHKENNKIVWLLLGNLYDINQEEEIVPISVLEKIARLFDMKL
ncbi:MAG: hypothetical protein GF368_02740 [Candidatus Aenigmarchaeota archaeon]|nr:hypothetical protein [Candidatus Aenigmarchaeota archaeon]